MLRIMGVKPIILKIQHPTKDQIETAILLTTAQLTVAAKWCTLNVPCLQDLHEKLWDHFVITESITTEYSSILATLLRLGIQICNSSQSLR